MVVDPWLEGVWNAIKEALSKMASNRTAHLKENGEDSAKETPDSSAPHVQLNLLNLTNHQNCESVKAADSEFASAASSSASAVSDVRPAPPAVGPVLASQASGPASVSTSASKTQAEDAEVPPLSLAASLTRSVPPLSESSLNVPALPPPFLDVSLEEVDTVEQVTNVTAEKLCILHLRCTSSH